MHSSRSSRGPLWTDEEADILLPNQIHAGARTASALASYPRGEVGCARAQEGSDERSDQWCLIGRERSSSLGSLST